MENIENDGAAVLEAAAAADTAAADNAAAAAGAEALLREMNGEIPAGQGNRYDRLFSSVLFSVSENGRVYPNDDGSKSTKVANVVCVLRDYDTAIPGTIYARKPAKGKVTVDFSFVGKQSASALKPLTEGAKVELAAWKVGIAAKYATWRKAQGATATPARVGSVEIDDYDFPAE